MKSRLIVAAVGIPLLLVILLACPKVCTVVAIAALMAIGARELLHTTGILRHGRMVVYSMIMALLVPFWCWVGSPIQVGAAALVVFMLILFGEALVAYPEVKFGALACCLMAGIVVPLGLSGVSRIMMMDYGRHLVIVPIMIPFVNDAGGYFGGMLFGKHKLAPVLSPKKTREGAVSGVVMTILAMMIYGLVMQFAFGFTYNYLYAVVYGIVGAVVSIAGDLAFSMIKREYGIKDYGTLFRAHGGVLDRFDSMIFTAPLVELMLLLLPLMAEKKGPGFAPVHFCSKKEVISMKTTTISILGSTGSIGRQTLSVAEHLGVKVCALTANENVDRIEQQARQFRPRLCVMGSEKAAAELKQRLSDLNITVLHGMDGLIAAATMEEAQVVITAVMGMVGLRPTLAAIEKKKRIGLANKETLVCAGQLVMDAADRFGAEIVPVDSEHSAIFQCLMGCRDRKEIKRLILTASGGPFYGKKFEELETIKKEDAFRHPTWTMGQKITIDSATMMNKGLEVIEAMRLYRLPKAQVDVVVHRQSIVHSLVEFCDGSIMAQLGVPDMRIPIQLALTYPNRMESPSAPLDLLTCGPLSFLPPDDKNFPCLAYAVEAAEKEGNACAVLNGANEAAVDLFLRDKIGFNDIPRRVRYAMDKVAWKDNPTLEDILEADRAARDCVYNYE